MSPEDGDPGHRSTLPRVGRLSAGLFTATVLERRERARLRWRDACRAWRSSGADDVREARRLAIAAQRLTGTRPATRQGILEVIRDIGYLQLDPTNVVARNPQLVL